ncbi:MAG: aquaporin [Nocardioides sp.]|uniref:aquaporin n=1 Tax=Nocardioides sp. TaxID=35761 RepID=UPI003F12562E
MTDTHEEPTLGQKVAAEIIGTFGLVFFAVGSAVFSQTLGQDSYVGVALAFGLSIIAFGYAFGRVSGAHFNPAVSIGAAMGGRISWSTAGIYSLAQIVGGLLGGGLICLIMFGFDGYSFGDFPLGANAFGDASGSGIAMWAALLVEFIATLAFVWVILGVTDERAKATTTHAVLAIGFALTLIHLALIGLTGTSVNPARSIGVAFFSGEDAIIQLWVFILAPVLGGIVAGLTYPLLFGRDGEPVAGSGLTFGGGPKAPQQFAGGYPAQQWGGQPGQQQQYWNQPGQPHPGAQQWGQQPPAAAPQPPAQQWGAPEQAQPQAPEQQQYWSQPGQQPAAPEQQAWGQPAPGAAPQQWGQPAAGDEDEGHTQIRRND